MAKEKKGVRLEHISKIYKDPKTGKEFYAVKDTSLNIEPGTLDMAAFAHAIALSVTPSMHISARAAFATHCTLFVHSLMKGTSSADPQTANSDKTQGTRSGCSRAIWTTMRERRLLSSPQSFRA